MASSHPSKNRAHSSASSPKTDSRPVTAVNGSPDKQKAIHRTQLATGSYEPKPPSAPSNFGRRNHRKSVLVPSNGVGAQILTDDDTAMLVKVDRRDSNHRGTPVANQRGGSRTTATETTSQLEEVEDAAAVTHGFVIEEEDNLSDFGSLHHHGGKTATYSNNADPITTNWDSLHLYRFNPEFNANEIQDVSVLITFDRRH